MRSGSELAETQRAQVVTADVVQPLEQEVEIVVDREMTAGQAVAASRREPYDQPRGAVRVGPSALGELAARPGGDPALGRVRRGVGRQGGFRQPDRQQAGMEKLKTLTASRRTSAARFSLSFTTAALDTE